MVSMAVLSNAWMLVLISMLFIGGIGMIVRYFKPYKRPFAASKITFVVAVWNEGRRVRECVNSILAQNYPREKVRIIVVGGGDDRTVTECKKLARSGVEFIHEKNRTGKWFALNTALKRVKTDYVAFADADCILERDWLRKMLSHDADIVISDFNSTSEKTLKDKFYGYILYLGPRLAEGINAFFKTGEFIGIGSVVKSKVFKKIKFRDSFVEDWWFAEDAKKHGFSVTHSTAKVYEHAPVTLNDLRKGLLKISKGFVLEAMQMKNLLSVFMTGFYVVAGFSIPINIYQIAKSDAFAINAMLLMIASLSLFSLICSAKYKSYRFILYSPMIIPLMAFVGVFSLEAVLRILAKQQIRWEIYNKTHN